MGGVVPRVDTHCGKETRDNVKLGNAERGVSNSDSCQATEYIAYVNDPAEYEVRNLQLQSSIGSGVLFPRYVILQCFLGD